MVNWLALFSNPEIVQIVLNSLTFLQSHQRLAIHGYVIMENHLHLIASSPNLSKEIANFKSFTARATVDWLKTNQSRYWLNQLAIHKQSYKTDQQYQMWQEGAHPQAILDWKMFQQKLAYIHNNPVQRGYVDDPSHWRYSSYRNYAGQEGILLIDWLEAK
nr:transposase [Leptothermofonsia sichuanensis]